MKLRSVAISGFFHFDRECRVDLSSLPHGLIAIVGQNGAGKTRLLEAALAATYYGPGDALKAFPSREKPLASYATSREAFIEAEWLLDGKGTFRARVNVDGENRSTSAVLSEVINDGRRTIPINDGKIRTFCDAVSEYFPSRRSLLASAFAAQTQNGGFRKLGQKERLELFAEFADLGLYEQRSVTSKRCADTASAILLRISTTIDVLMRDVSDERIAALVASLETARTDLSSARTRIVKQQAAIADVSATIAKQTAVMASLAIAASNYTRAEVDVNRLTDVKAQIAARRRTAEVESTKAKAAADTALATSTHALEAQQAIAERAEAQITKQLRERLAVAQEALALAPMIEQAEREIASTEQEIADGRNAIAELDDNEIVPLRAELLQLAERKTSREVAHAALTTARRSAALIGEVKFGDECAVDPVCPLVREAAAARASLPTLEESISASAGLDDETDSLRRRLEVTMAKHRERSQAIYALERSVSKLRAITAKASDVAAARSRIDEVTKAQADLAEGTARRHTQAMASLADYAKRAQHAIADADDRCASTLEAIASDERVCDQQLRAAWEAVEASSEAQSKHAAADAELSRLTAQRMALNADERLSAIAIATRESEIAALVAQQADLDARRQSLTRWQSSRRVVEDEALAWTALARACGRDGLQRLEIDAAGPVVSDLANQLMRVAYGARYGIDLVTQVATADGKDVKEQFTVLALDNEHGGEPRDIRDLSGGEGIIADEVLRGALACYVALHSRERFRTLFRDETTGALDPDTAPRYVAMLRKLVALSGAEQCLFITHSPSCAALADAQLHVVDGRCDVVLPPYGETYAAPSDAVEIDEFVLDGGRQ